MLKKFGLALSVASLGITGAFADECDPCYCGGFTVGMEMAHLHHETMMFLTVGYIDECFLFDIGGNYQHWGRDHSSSSSSDSEFFGFDGCGGFTGHERSRNIGYFLGHLGLRAQVYQDIYFTYGVQGSVGTKSFDNRALGSCGFTTGGGSGGHHDRNRIPYTVGAFGGLDIQLNDHYLLTGKIYAFSYQKSRGSDSDVKYAVFESGVLGIAYVF